METVVPLLITHHSKLFREALRPLFANTRFRPVHAAPNLDQASEGYLAAGGNCVWLIGVEKYTAAANSLACRVGAIAPEVKRVILAASQIIEDPMIAINNGVCGFLCEDISPDQLIKSLELIVDGEMVVHGQAFQQARQLLTTLTETQIEETVLQKEKINAAATAIDNRTVGSVAVGSVAVGSVAVASVIDSSCAPQDVERELSNRERLIMQKLISGNSNKAIARDLVITEATVKVHIKAILRKLRLRNRTQAAIWAREHLFRSGNNKEVGQRF
jgi:two-component system nitrate/nitrite response regulator NarL